MRKYALGVAVAAVGIVTQALPASADKLDDLIKRMDSIEQSNKQLAKENAALRAQLKKPPPATVVAAPGAPARASVTGIAIPPHALDTPEIDAQGHGFLEHKKGNPLTFYTPGGEITAYGNIDVSVDGTTKSLTDFNTPALPGVNTGGVGGAGGSATPVGNFGWLPAISSNSSYLGVRGLQRLDHFPFNFVYQLEVGFDVSATPGLKQTNSQVSNVVNGALFNRNTYVGFASPEFGALKIGKTDAPYATSTGGFNPFAGQIGDYRVIMGNTGGDNRVEFGGRLDHSIWYESPTIGGFQWNLLFSPGQNRSTINDNIASGESDCTAGNDPTSGGNAPVTCSDGAFGNAVSTNLSYTNGPFYATVAYERRFATNRQSDIAAIYGLNSFSPIQAFNNCASVAKQLPAGSQQQANFTTLCNADVADEDAFKVAGTLYPPDQDHGRRHLGNDPPLRSGNPGIPERTSETRHLGVRDPGIDAER
jgi:predicted porin